MKKSLNKVTTNLNQEKKIEVVNGKTDAVIQETKRNMIGKLNDLGNFENKEILDWCRKSLDDDLVRASDDLRRAKNEFKGLSTEQMKEQYGPKETKQQVLEGYQKQSDEYNNAKIFLGRLLTGEDMTTSESKQYLTIILYSISKKFSRAKDDLNRSKDEFKGFSAEQMAEEHGPGEMRHQVVDSYQKQYDGLSKAENFIEGLL